MSTIKTSIFTAAFGLALHASAHGRVGGVLADGKYYIGADPYASVASAGWKAANNDNGFATSVTSEDIICHNSAVAGSEYVTVSAGSTLEMQWTTWPESHKGPVIDYLAPCGDDCTTVDKTSLQFTKIQESGLLDASAQSWASDDLISNNFTGLTTIPTTIAPGKYVLRHEIIALHSAGSEGGVQAYPQCFNVEVTGSGSNSLASGTVGTSLYTPTDPGILVNIYYPVLTSYDIPGPALMEGGSEGSDSGSGTDTPSSSAAASSSVAATTSAAAAPGTTTSIAVTASVTSAVAVGTTTTTSSAAEVTATAGGKKFICYEEL